MQLDFYYEAELQAILESARPASARFIVLMGTITVLEANSRRDLPG